MRTFNRRQFNQGVGASLLLAPFASMLAPRPASAAAVKQAKRVLFFCTMGTHTPLWTPKFSGENITASMLMILNMVFPFNFGISVKTSSASKRQSDQFRNWQLSAKSVIEQARTFFEGTIEVDASGSDAAL